MMMNLNIAVEKAKHSSFYRTILNWTLDRMIPLISRTNIEFLKSVTAILRHCYPIVTRISII